MPNLHIPPPLPLYYMCHCAPRPRHATWTPLAQFQLKNLRLEEVVDSSSASGRDCSVPRTGLRSRAAKQMRGIQKQIPTTGGGANQRADTQVGW